ncbi:MAG: T9SS type A sorting domain-containing protein [bacterium]
MKKILLLTLSIGLMTICKAQQFSFILKFIDAVGNTDSITLGYDLTATDTLDLSFGETNIISTPYTSGLDVRAGNVWFQQNSFPGFGQIPFETKKQIVPNTCGSGNFWLIFPVIEINIVSHYFPVKAYWNKILFNDSCKNGSVFTSVHPGGWWDTGGFRIVLNLEDSTTFYQNQYYYLSGTDTVNVYWAAFSDSTLLAVAVNELEIEKYLLKIFPNPTSDFATISVSKTFGEINRVELLNSVGQLTYCSKQLNNIDIKGLPKGLYFIKVTNSKGLTAIAKLQKI